MELCHYRCLQGLEVIPGDGRYLRNLPQSEEQNQPNFSGHAYMCRPDIAVIVLNTRTI